jgi:hypothetical protein
LFQQMARDSAMRAVNRTAPALRGAASMIFALLALQACAGDDSIARFQDAHVLYDGPPFGDLLVLANAVRSCMKTDKQTLPRVILVDQIFECYTTAGWKEVYGCTGDGRVFIVAPIALQSDGQLWSHELTHWYGDSAENDSCGYLALPGFKLDIPDAGT